MRRKRWDRAEHHDKLEERIRDLQILNWKREGSRMAIGEKREQLTRGKAIFHGHKLGKQRGIARYGSGGKKVESEGAEGLFYRNKNQRQRSCR